MCGTKISYYTRSGKLRVKTVYCEKEMNELLRKLEYLEATEIILGDEGTKRPISKEAII